MKRDIETISKLQDLLREEVGIHEKWLKEGKLTDGGRAMEWNRRAAEALK